MCLCVQVWEWKRLYGGRITDQLRRVGASLDWSREVRGCTAGAVCP